MRLGREKRAGEGHLMGAVGVCVFVCVCVIFPQCLLDKSATLNQPLTFQS